MKYFLLFFVSVLCINNNLKAQGCSLVSFNTLPSATSTAKNDTTVCRGNCLNLFASLPVLKQTTSYTVTSIPYIDTLPCETTGTVPSGFTLPDDQYSGIIPLNFNFCFYNNTYSNIVICDNGFITFSTNKANISGSGIVPWRNTTVNPKPLPSFATSSAVNSSNFFPHNSILGAFIDVFIPSGGSITTQTIGTAPYSAFVVKYNNCRYFNCSSNSTIVLNMKIVLYQTTNMIDIYIKTNPGCTTTSNGSQAFTQGIQGNNSSQWIASPGRNGTVWNGANTAYRFTPDGSNNPVTFAWFKNSNTSASLGATSTLNICPTDDSAYYTAQATITSTCPATTTILKDTLKVKSIIPSTSTTHIYDTIRCVDSFTLNGFKLNTVKYKWDNGATSSNLKIGASGNYTIVRYMDSIECTRDSLFFHIIKIGNPKIDSIVSTGCYTSNVAGNLNVYTSGDTMGIKFGKDTFTMNTNKNISNVYYGSTKIWVKNNFGCKVFMDKFNDSLSTSLIKNTVTCTTDTTGSLRLQTNGGVAPYLYKLNGGAAQVIDSFKNLSPGIYTIQVTDNIGCIKSYTDSIKIISSFAISYAIDSLLCHNTTNGKITIIPQGGTTPYKFSVNYSAYGTNTVFSSLGAGSYYVRSKDIKNCFKDTTIVLNNPPKLIPTYTFDSSCQTFSNGTITINGSGGRSPYTFKINSNPYQSSGNFSSLSPGTYVVSIKDNVGCNIDSNISIGSRPQPQINLVSKKNITCFGLNNGFVKLSASNSVAPYSFNWSNGSTKDSIVNLGVNNYKVTVTDVKGCVDTANYSITSPDSIQINLLTKHISCFNSNNGKIKASVIGGTTPYLYSKDNITYQTSDSFVNLNLGNFTIYVKDSNNCIKSKSSTITQPNLLVVNIIRDTISCFGASTGNIILNTSGGTPSYLISLNNGTFSSLNTFNSLTANTYNFKIKDTNNCIIDTNITLTQYTQINNTISTTKTCKNYSSGTIINLTSGGKAPYTYRKNGGSYQASPNFSNLYLGNYTIDVKDALNCIQTSTIFIDTFHGVYTQKLAHKNISCNGLTDGKLKIAGSGGTAPYTYLWGNGSTSDSMINLSVNNYLVVVTDSKSCSDTQVYPITQPPILTASFNLTHPLCFGDTNGRIRINANGGTAPYVYSKNNVTYQSIDSIINLSAGNHTLFIKDLNNCTSNYTQTLIQPNELKATYNIDSVSCYGGNNGRITTNPSGGTLPYSYNINLAGYNLSNIANNLVSGTYNIKVKDAHNCSLDSNKNVAQYDSLNLNYIIDSITCKNYSDGKISATTSGGAPPYLYSLNGSTYSSNAIFNNLSSGTYSLSVKDAKNCIKSKTVVIINPDGMTNIVTTPQQVLCYSSNEGKAKVTISGGTAPYSILWKNGSTQDSSILLIAGTHYVKITDSKSCKDSISFTITQPDTIQSARTLYHPKCFNDTNGAIKLTTSGGTTPYQYAINGGTFQNIDSFGMLAQGIYSISIKDINLCTKNYIVQLFHPTKLITTIVIDSVHCFGQNTGKITLSPSGGTPTYTYKRGSILNPGPIFNNLTVGTHSIKITDNNNCQLDTQLTIYQYPDIISTLNVEHLKCHNQAIGKITINSSGGTGTNYTFSLNNAPFQPNNVYSNLAAGTYNISIKDAYQCTDTISTTITQPLPLIFNAQIQNLKCYNISTGKINLSPSGGISPYVYSFQNGAYSNVDSFINLAAGTYNLRIKDSNLCIYTQNLTITQAPKINISVITDSVKCYGTNTGSFTVPTSGGTAPFYYSLDSITFVTTNNFTNLYADQYKLWIKDANNCFKDTLIDVKTPDSLYATFIVDSVKCFNQNNGVISTTAIGGTKNYVYSYNSASNVSNSVISNLSSGTHTVKITDAKLCNKTYNFTLNNPPQILIRLDSIIHNKCYNDAKGKIKISASGGRGTLSYNWSNGGNSDSIIQQIANTYSLTITDSKNCTEVYSNTILQPNELKSSFIKKDLSCFQSGDGSLQVIGTGGTTPYTYNWSNAALNPTILNLTKGKYIVTITDNNSCIKWDSIIVNEPAPINFSLNATKSNCKESNNGAIQATNFTGGTPAYNFNWSNGNNNSTINNLKPLQYYTLTVSDQNLCKSIDSIYVDTMYSIRIGLTYTSPKCPNSPINININTYSGVAPFDFYVGSNQNNTGQFTNIREDIYTVKVVDKIGCSYTSIEDMRIKDPMVAKLINYIPYCTSANIWSSKLNVSGGVKPYKFLWPGAFNIMNDSAQHNKKGTFTVTVIDNNLCEISKTFTLDPPDFLISATIQDKIDLRCYQIPEGKMTVQAKGGTPPYHYLWSQGDTTKTILNLKAHTVYTVTAYDSKGCSYYINDTLSEPRPMDMKYIKKDETCINYDDGSVSLHIKGGTSPKNLYTYSKDNLYFQSDNNFSFLSPNTYQIYGRDENLCIDSIEVIIAPFDSFTHILDSIYSVKLGEEIMINPSVLFTNPSVQSTLTYLWTPNFGLSCSDCAQPIFSAYTSQQYRLRIGYNDQCSWELHTKVNVSDIKDEEFYIPSAFSPNQMGENENETFKAYGNRVISFSMSIFNTWGEKLFYSDNINNGWDGNYKGEPAPTGNYIYKINASFIDGRKIERNGSLSLMR